MTPPLGDLGAEYTAAIEGAALFDVSDRGKIELAGRDAISFLHNLSTADIKQLQPGSGCETFLATAKAKAVAFALVFRREASVWLDVDPGRGPALFQHLDHFLISEQVELSDRTGELAQFHLHGPDAAKKLSTLLGEAAVPYGTLATVAGPGPVEVRRVSAQGFDLLTEPLRAADLSRSLVSAGAVPAGLEVYEILRVEAGLPKWGAELDENRSVFELCMNQRAICYTKGCYLGQEPIVMARDRGHINRTLMGLRIDGDVTAITGAVVWQGEQEVGQVTSAVVSPRLGAIALAYLKRRSQEAGMTLEVEVRPGVRAKATVTALPFPPSEPEA